MEEINDVEINSPEQLEENVAFNAQQKELNRLCNIREMEIESKRKERKAKRKAQRKARRINRKK